MLPIFKVDKELAVSEASKCYLLFAGLGPSILGKIVFFPVSQSFSQYGPT